MKRGLILLMLPLLLSSCRGSEGLTIIRLSDEKVIGRDSPKGRYRDMVLGCDEAKGRVAIIEWGDYKSTIKVFDFTAGTFTKRTVPVGRSNGLEGPEYYDFASDEYILHDRHGIHFFGKAAQRRDVANPLPEGFWGSKIVPCKDGLLIKCGNSLDGSHHDTVVYRYQQSGSSIKAIYQSGESTRAIFGRHDRAVLVEDIQADYKNRRLVTIDMEGKVLSETTMPMHITERLKMDGGTVYELYGDGVCRLQHVSLDQGGTLREDQFAGVSSDITGFDVKGSLLVVGEMLSRESSQALSATVLDLETKQVRKRLKGQWAWSDLILMKFNGELYCILSN